MLERVMQFRKIPWNVPESEILVRLEENLTDCRFTQLSKGNPTLVSIVKVLLEKSMMPERFAQRLNALNPNPSVLNDIGAKISTPVPEQLWKAPGPKVVNLEEEKDATSLWQLSNPNVPMSVNVIALIFVMVVRFVHPLNPAYPILLRLLVVFRLTRIKFVQF